MISYLTGGNLCYGQPVNILGLVMTIVVALVIKDIIKSLWRNR
ncbi:hypothetical protein [Mesorhizobium sp. M4B.F.Ca.ET.058.02.1.1]|nr:hypothetical protein [Mesorhizobium sp. M4B.F.Ca.ET.058.02.1.1]